MSNSLSEFLQIDVANKRCVEPKKKLYKTDSKPCDTVKRSEDVTLQANLKNVSKENLKKGSFAEADAGKYADKNINDESEIKKRPKKEKKCRKRSVMPCAQAVEECLPYPPPGKKKLIRTFLLCVESRRELF